MTLTRIACLMSLAAQVAVAPLVFADCALPKAPGPVPNGSSASAAEMETAKTTLDRYQKAIKDYLTCTEQESKTRIAELGDKVDMIRQVKLMTEKRNTSIQETLQTHADDLNDQLRAFKLTNRE